MASLADFYQPPSTTPQAFIDASTNQQSGDATANAGLQMSLAQRQYETRTLPDFVNSQAARGAFYSGATVRGLNRAEEDYTTQQGQTQLALSQTLATLSRNRILASLGISV